MHTGKPDVYFRAWSRAAGAQVPGTVRLGHTAVPKVRQLSYLGYNQSGLIEKMWVQTRFSGL